MSLVEVKSVDSARVRRCTDEYARRLLAMHPEVEEIVVFGSFADDTYAPGSDLDLFILLGNGTGSPRDRVARFLPASFPVPVDVFAFTRAEVAELASSPIMAAVENSGWRYKR